MLHKLIRVWKWWKSSSHLPQMHVTLSKKCLSINLTQILSTFNRVNQRVKQVFCVLYVSPRLVLSRKRLWNTFQVPLSDHNKCNVLTNSYWIASCSNSWLSSLTKNKVDWCFQLCGTLRLFDTPGDLLDNSGLFLKCLKHIISTN